MISTSGSLLTAADSYPMVGAPENRLTEIFAEVLRSAPKLAGWLVGRAEELIDVPRSEYCAAGYEVTTQITFNHGAQRPDLQLISRDALASPFYFEIKLAAEFTAAQLADYPKRTVGIVPRSRVGDPEAPFRCLDWTEVARASHDLGVGWGGGDWRIRAKDPDAPSQFRLLYELVTYLERNLGVVVPQPISESDVSVYATAEPKLARWDLLIDLVRALLETAPGVDRGPEPWNSERRANKRSLGRSIMLAADPVWPSLQASLESGATDDWWIGYELLLAPEVTWVGQVEPEPAFGVGAVVGLSPDWPQGLQEGGPFALAATDAGFTLGTTWRGRVGRVFQTKYLREVVTAADSLDGQAEAVATWVNDTLAVLRSLSPAHD